MSVDQQTAYALSAREAAADHVVFWREPRFDDLECLAARFSRHSYRPHVHDTFAIGVILAGAEAFHYRGVRHVAPAGRVVAVNPDELHDGAAAADSFAYRMLYPSVGLMQRLADDIAGAPAGFPAFAEAVIDDPEVAAGLVAAHGLMQARAGRLAVDEAVTAALSLMLRRHSQGDPRGRRPGQAAGPLRRARELIDDLYMQDLTLDELAACAGLSRFHFLRAFRRAVGVTPHAYLAGRRIAAAKTLLAGAQPLSEVALACGFYDQSHFSRSFKGCTGLTPGQYRRGSQVAA
jgi:AraC-like DNA-binding protein